MEQTVVDVNDLSRSFGGKAALDGVSFRAIAGQVHGLVGSNGAGKTTLLKHLLGLLRATTGSVRVFGLDPVRDPVGVLRRVGYLSEERDLPEWMSVEELMRYSQAFHPSWDPSYARELLETFALDPAKKIKQLSKGMRAQAGLIAAVAHRPDLLILDEPSSGLDAVVPVTLDITNSEGRHFVFSDASRSMMSSAARAVIAMVQYFVNAERAFLTLHNARRDALARGREDLVSRYTAEMAEVVESTSYAEVIANIRKELG